MRPSSRTSIALLAALTLMLPQGDPRAQETDGSSPAPATSDSAGAASLSVLPPCPRTDARARSAWLAARIDHALAAAGLREARVGIEVADTGTGRVLLSRHATDRFNAASNVKLVTTAAALALLGPDYRWRTALYAEGWSPRERAIHGDLYLQGNGDPGLVNEDLLAMAAELAGRGVRRIAGGIVVDDSFFDEARLGPGFEEKTEDAAFRAAAGAVSLDYNAVAVTVSPGAGEGAPARVTVEPASAYVLVTNAAVTRAAGDTALDVSELPDEDHAAIRVAGSVRLGSAPIPFYKRVARPDVFTGTVLAADLAHLGIKLGRPEIRKGHVPEGARAMAVHLSEPLSVIVRAMNKESNNFMAEQIFKTLGAVVEGPPGTWDKGLAAVSRFLATVGVPPGSYEVRNGSGLYDSSRLEPDQLVRLLLASYRDFRYSADFLASLAIAAEDGTIRHRMLGSDAARLVRAKTGTLDGVSCLSGYAGADGPDRPDPLAFAILMNDVPKGKTALARQAQDEIATALVDFLEAGGP